MPSCCKSGCCRVALEQVGLKETPEALRMWQSVCISINNGTVVQTVLARDYAFNFCFPALIKRCQSSELISINNHYFSKIING